MSNVREMLLCQNCDGSTCEAVYVSLEEYDRHYPLGDSVGFGYTWRRRCKDCGAVFDTVEIREEILEKLLENSKICNFLLESFAVASATDPKAKKNFAEKLLKS